MRFCSTRGGAVAGGATFERCISSGYAPDGGLFVPEALPHMSLDDLARLKGLDYQGLATALMSLFVGEELGTAELEGIVRACYADFAVDEIVPVRRVGAFFVSELFHGPTFCFKDLGQQPLVRLIARFAERKGSQKTMLVSTTGDTGPAAMRAAGDARSPNLKIIVFYPEGLIYDFQRKQMTTITSDRARVASFEGGGDDMDAPLKHLGADTAFAERHGLVGVNSYNLGRPVAQLVHYFWTYFRVIEQAGLRLGDPIDAVIPTGAMGNIAAAFMAKRMGLPLRRLVAGVNSNDITHRTFSTGEFHRSDRMEKTLSDAINIQVPYNMERVLYYLTGENSALVAEWMADMERTSKLTLPKEWLQKLQDVFGSSRVDDADMCAVLRECLDQHAYLLCPHSAVAMGAAWNVYGKNAEKSTGGVPVAVFATASPCKFEHSITAAVGAATWERYLSGPTFPEAGRAVLSAPEQPYPTLQRVSGNLEASQAAWEAEVRKMLGEDAAPRARL